MDVEISNIDFEVNFVRTRKPHIKPLLLNDHKSTKNCRQKFLSKIGEKSTRQLQAELQRIILRAYKLWYEPSPETLNNNNTRPTNIYVVFFPLVKFKRDGEVNI